MQKLYRVLGRQGRVTIPYEMRARAGFAFNDILSFTEQEDHTILIRREKICDGCKETEPESGTEEELTLLEFLNGLSEEQQHAALLHLSVKWAEKQGTAAQTKHLS